MFIMVPSSSYNAIPKIRLSVVVANVASGGTRLKDGVLVDKSLHRRQVHYLLVNLRIMCIQNFAPEFSLNTSKRLQAPEVRVLESCR